MGKKYIYQTTDQRLFNRDPLLDNLLDIMLDRSGDAPALKELEDDEITRDAQLRPRDA